MNQNDEDDPAIPRPSSMDAHQQTMPQHAHQQTTPPPAPPALISRRRRRQLNRRLYVHINIL